jgi:hypothetical protein
MPGTPRPGSARRGDCGRAALLLIVRDARRPRLPHPRPRLARDHLRRRARRRGRHGPGRPGLEPAGRRPRRRPRGDRGGVRLQRGLRQLQHVRPVLEPRPHPHRPLLGLRPRRRGRRGAAPGARDRARGGLGTAAHREPAGPLARARRRGLPLRRHPQEDRALLLAGEPGEPPPLPHPLGLPGAAGGLAGALRPRAPGRLDRPARGRGGRALHRHRGRGGSGAAPVHVLAPGARRDARVRHLGLVPPSQLPGRDGILVGALDPRLRRAARTVVDARRAALHHPALRRHLRPHEGPAHAREPPRVGGAPTSRGRPAARARAARGRRAAR